jgi:hypothetical protein
MESRKGRSSLHRYSASTISPQSTAPTPLRVSLSLPPLLLRFSHRKAHPPPLLLAQLALLDDTLNRLLTRSLLGEKEGGEDVEGGETGGVKDYDS